MRSEPAGGPPRLAVLGHPRSRRIAGWRQAADRLGFDLTVVGYPDLLDGRFLPAPGDLVRLESPGECPETARRLLSAGIAPMEARRRVPIGPREIADLSAERGAILHPLQWYLGFRRVLEELEDAWADRRVRWVSPPRSVAAAFDKLDCLDRWAAAGLPTPRRLSAAATYAGLRGDVPDRHARVFVKLRYGYSAMGAVALEWRGDLVRAITTVEVAWARGRPRLFVSKRPRVLRRESEIAWLLDTLGMEEILAEEWLPKARRSGLPFDLRIVVANGSAGHAVGRAGRSPFTNLNLGAARIPREEVADLLGDAWPAACRLAEAAAAELPGSAALGLDLLVRPCRRRFALLEANAFGDHLPGLTHRGLSTYEAQLENLLPAREAVA